MISGMQMGNIVYQFLKDEEMNTQKLYKSAYNFAKTHVEKIKNGEGHGTRYYYKKDNVIPALEEWKAKTK